MYKAILPILPPISSEYDDSVLNINIHSAPAGADANARWLATDTHGRSHGEISAWWRNAPQLLGERTGCIGALKASNTNAALALIHVATRALSQAGCTLAIGPMDGNSWHNYRAVTRCGTRAPFLFEPSPHAIEADCFEEAGYSVLARYSSSESTNLSSSQERAAKYWQSLTTQGFEITTLDGETIENMLPVIHAFMSRSFSDNFLYSPISYKDFLARYRPIIPYIDMRTLIAVRHQGKLAGLLFAIPDLMQAERGESIDTLIYKTLAIDPDYRSQGLSLAMTLYADGIAESLGYRRVIHALMHEHNRSLITSDKLAVRFREYALFARRLAS